MYETIILQNEVFETCVIQSLQTFEVEHETDLSLYDKVSDLLTVNYVIATILLLQLLIQLLRAVFGYD